MFQVFVGLDAAVLRTLVVQGPRGVEERHVAVPAGAQVHLLQLQPVGRVQVLLRVPEHPAVQGLTCRGRRADRFICRIKKKRSLKQVFASTSCRTHGEGSLVVHLSHGDVRRGRVQQEDLLVVAQLELRVQGVDDRNGSVGLLEGDRDQEPVKDQRRRTQRFGCFKTSESGDVLQPNRTEPLRSVSGAGQRFVPRVDPGLGGLHGAGDQKHRVLSGVVLPVEEEYKTNAEAAKHKCSCRVLEGFRLVLSRGAPIYGPRFPYFWEIC